jgi:SAM-dependent methyltransferase
VIVDRIGLRAGDSVLDACCGTGSSALPAAERVGPAGLVVGIDVTERALVEARSEARVRGLTSVSFYAGDAQRTGLPSEVFDAVLCVFGVFFFPDMVAGVRELWRLVRPGGRLGLTVWGRGHFEPASSAFWEAVEAECPELAGGCHPWDRVTTPEGLRSLLKRGGIAGADIVMEEGEDELSAAEDWWTILLGTCGRATVEQLGPWAGQRVRTATLTSLQAQHVRSVTTNVIYAIATKQEPTERRLSSLAAIPVRPELVPGPGNHRHTSR